MRKPLSILFSVALALAMLPATSFAAPVAQPDADAPLAAQAGENIASGTWGTCPWEISADGVLTVHPGEGADTNYESPWGDYVTEITKVIFKAENGGKVIAPADCGSLLSVYGSKVSSIDLSGLDTSQTTDMGDMFQQCESLTSLDLSPLDTSNVTDMSGMFAYCSSLTSLDLSPLDTSNVTGMHGTFSGCSSLVSLNLSGLDTSSVTWTRDMFYGCSSLVSLNLSGLDTSSVDEMSYMFSGCSSLASLDLSSLDTSNVMIADEMFYDCTSLSSVKVGPKTLVNIELPTDTVNGHADWYSKVAGAWFTSEQVSAQRKSIADTYLKEESADDEPGTAEPVGTQAMYRLYNPNSGEHFYTASTVERDAVIAAGWNDEGIGWTAPTEGIQVYRLYNSYAGEHHYTTSAEERDMLVGVGWTWEEGGWFSDPDESVPLYRAYNPNAFANNHHYTTDRGEFETLLSLGWQDEGVGWHGVK